jgi:hypothetical protein
MEAAKLVLEFLERDKADKADQASSVTPVLTYVTLCHPAVHSACLSLNV